jgi:hypothetical protein
VFVLTFATLIYVSQPARADFMQQGGKLVGTVAVAPENQGQSVAVSADGNTAIVGGWADNSYAGAAWVFTRSGGVWTQQGPKLVGTLAVGAAYQGWSVGLSADGNTAIVGGPGDNINHGAAWVFTRIAGVWSQQGSKLFGIGAVGNAQQGLSVALSGDGNTAIVGGPNDNSGIGTAWVFAQGGGLWGEQAKLVGTGNSGAAGLGYSVALSADGSTAIVGGPNDASSIGATWIFTRSNGPWTQQGGKLVGTGNVGGSSQGGSVALSSDGNTAIVGGDFDNSNAGAAWVFTRSSNAWTQQGSKLVGTGAVGNAQRGSSVALSGDGNTAIVGGHYDNFGAATTGAVWAYRRSGVVWGQQGSKLVGTGIAGTTGAEQGISVALSADGSTAIVGGTSDNNGIGAAWVFVQTATHDFNGDHKSDIIFRNSSSGATVGWLMNGSAVTQSAAIGTVATHWNLVGQRDFNGDGKSDLLWRDSTSGAISLWLMNGLSVTQSLSVGTVPIAWVLSGVGDFNGDGKADIVWRNSSTGAVTIWLMNGATVTQAASAGSVPLNWSIVGAGPGNQILWRDSNTGTLIRWTMNGTAVSASTSLGTVPPVWTIVGTGDFDGNGSQDILWRNSSSGALAVWLFNGNAVLSSTSLGTIPNTWSVDLTGDFNGNGKSDIVWTQTSGARAIWFMNGATVASTAGLGTLPTAWVIQSAGAE